MAKKKPITIPLYLPPCEAAALARLISQITQVDCARLAAPYVTYGEDARPERDVMFGAVLTLQGALAGIGFLPRRG